MAEVTFVPVFPHPLPESVNVALRAAKASLNLEVKMLPVPAVPGSPGLVLALGRTPDFVCDGCLAATPEALPDALYRVLTDGRRDFTVEAYMKALLGAQEVLVDA